VTICVCVYLVSLQALFVSVCVYMHIYICVCVCVCVCVLRGRADCRAFYSWRKLFYRRNSLHMHAGLIYIFMSADETVQISV